MPQRSRSRRAAARQTQLGQRKKRQTKGPSGIPSATEAPGSTGAVERADASGEERLERPRSEAIVAQRPWASRQTESRPTVYNYVKPEIKRIMVLSAGILVILGALSFVLR